MTPELNNRLTRCVHQNTRGNLTTLSSGINSSTGTSARSISAIDMGRHVAHYADLLNRHHPIFT